MQVILKEDVANLGYKDDVVTVKSGYGRNYLIPQGKAVIASPSALKVREEDLKQRAHKLEKIKADAEPLFWLGLPLSKACLLPSVLKLARPVLSSGL